MRYQVLQQLEWARPCCPAPQVPMIWTRPHLMAASLPTWHPTWCVVLSWLACTSFAVALTSALTVGLCCQALAKRCRNASACLCSSLGLPTALYSFGACLGCSSVLHKLSHGRLSKMCVSRLQLDRGVAPSDGTPAADGLHAGISGWLWFCWNANSGDTAVSAAVP